MNRPRCAIVVVLVAVSCAATRGACAAESLPRPNPWTHHAPSADQDRFRFAVVADRTGGHRPGVFIDAVRKLNLLQPNFVMSVGDLVEGDTDDAAEIDQMWDEFDGIVGRLEMPFYFVSGNHGISNEVMASKWTERFGRTYYHFIYRDILFLCLNTEEEQATGISRDQVEYFANTLREHPAAHWTLVFMHKPLWMDQTDRGWLEIEKLLQNRPYTVFAGHLHQYLKSTRFGRRYFVLATTGAVSTLDGPAHGLFDHIMWVTMTDEGPQIANLMLDGIWD